MEFLDRIKDFSNDRPLSTKFLSLTEQAQLQKQLRNKVVFRLYGGYQNAEYKRAYINSDYQNITCFRINYNKKFLTLSHQNILGTLMSLNIERDTIGDILPNEDCFFVLSELKEFIVQELTSISSVTVTLEEIEASNFTRTEELLKDKTFIESLRLDLVVARICSVSRIEAKTMIDNDMIKVNHLVINKPTKQLEELDILSIRKYGRFKLLDTTKTSKKGKIVLIYGKFV